MKESETILETNRLILRTWTKDDAEALYAILADEKVVRYIANGNPFNFEKVREFLLWAENYHAEKRVLPLENHRKIRACDHWKLRFRAG